MNKAIFILLIFNLSIIYGFSQTENQIDNLVFNSGFDSYEIYRDDNSNLVFEPKYWFYEKKANPHPIYFCTDKFLDNSIMKNNAHPDGLKILQGKIINYVGMPILPKPEKIYSKLKNPLYKDSLYYFKVEIKSYDYSNCFSDLQVSFSDSIPNNANYNQSDYILITPDTITAEYVRENWISLSLYFIAKGGEQYLSIGSGSAEDYKRIISENLSKFDNRNEYIKHFYLKYCVDNVVLNKITTNHTRSFSQILDSLNIGESIILENILFEYNKSELLKGSDTILSQLLNFLNNHQNVKILIIGHTDNLGTESYNQDLSLNRAKTVAEYLIDKGIDPSRLQCKGMGASRPIENNDSEAGRKTNRRVEMKIVGK